MASNHHPSPTMMQMQQQQQHRQQQAHQQSQQQAAAPPPPHPGQPGPPPGAQQGYYPTERGTSLAAMNEAVWIQIGSVAELMHNPDEAMLAYERALAANPSSIPALSAIGMSLKGRENFKEALRYFNAIVELDQNNGEAWGNLGHCYLMTENLQKAYDAYQTSLVNLRDPKDPMLWYGIGILYDRYGSYDYAEDAFSQVMRIAPEFDKRNEIYFRLGIIYKSQARFDKSLECFQFIVASPPQPLTQEDIWFQIGHVHEQQKEFEAAKKAYQKVLDAQPAHAKVLQQLGWLHHQQNTSYESQDRAIQYLEKSVGSDNSDAQSWYLLGRCYMAQQKYPKAYEAYQQAVYRDGKNPTFWCSIGVLYYQINQYRDALDAYSRAIRLNPYISEVWYDLGTLYESCNNQITDAMDAYQRAHELDPNNGHIKARLELLRSGGGADAQGAAPQPADMHPQAYPPSGPSGPSWPGSTQQPGANGAPPPPPGSGESWAGRLSSVNPPPQPANPYEGRSDQFRGQAPPIQRQPTPQQEQGRTPYAEQGRGAPQRRSPPPGAGPPYQQGPPPPPAQSQPPAQGQPQPTHPPGSANGRRSPNRQWRGAVPSASGSADSSTPFRAANDSPRPNGRPPHDARMPSPKSAYPQQQPSGPAGYPHHPEAERAAYPEGGPPPAAMAEGPASRPDDRPSSVGPKRMREWEEDSAAKKQANEENRARLDDSRHRRPSTPAARPDNFRQSSSDAQHFEEQRRAEEPRRAEEARPPAQGEPYHPSEAAHHPQSHGSGPPVPIPSMPAQGTTPLPGIKSEKPTVVTPQEERPPAAADAEPASAARPAAASAEPERAARKMDVDEDYDDSAEEEKKAPVANGSGPGSAAGDAKAASPASGAVNGTSSTAIKNE